MSFVLTLLWVLLSAEWEARFPLPSSVSPGVNEEECAEEVWVCMRQSSSDSAGRSLITGPALFCAALTSISHSCEDEEEEEGKEEVKEFFLFVPCLTRPMTQ